MTIPDSEWSKFLAAYRRECAAQHIEPSDLLLGTKDNERNILDLSTVTIGLKGAIALSNALAAVVDTVQFVKIDISESFMGDEGCERLCAELQNQRYLHTLILRGANIHKSGCYAVCSLIRALPSLTDISLEWNTFGADDSVLEDLCAAVKEQKKLKYLDLRNNKIGRAGGEIIARLLSDETSLERIDLRWNNLGIASGKLFATAMEENYHITHLELGGNDCEFSSLQSIDRSLSRNREQEFIEKREKAIAQTAAVNAQLEAMNAEKAVKVEELQKELEQETELRRQLQWQLETEMDQRSTAVQNAEEAQAELERRTAVHEETTSDKERTISALEKRCDTLERELEEERERNTKMHGQLHGFDDLAEENRRLKSKINEMEVEMFNYKREKDDLMTKADEAESKLSRFRLDVDERIERVKKSVEKEYQDSVASWREKAEQFASMQEDLESQLVAKTDECVQLRDRERKKVKESNAQIIALKSELRENEEKVMSMTTNLEEHEEQLKQAKADLDRAEKSRIDAISEWEKKCAVLQRTVRLVNDEKRDYIENLENQVRQLNDKVYDVENSLKHAEWRIKKCKDDEEMRVLTLENTIISEVKSALAIHKQAISRAFTSHSSTKTSQSALVTSLATASHVSNTQSTAMGGSNVFQTHKDSTVGDLSTFSRRHNRNPEAYALSSDRDREKTRERESEKVKEKETKGKEREVEKEEPKEKVQREKESKEKEKPTQQQTREPTVEPSRQVSAAKPTPESKKPEPVTSAKTDSVAAKESVPAKKVERSGRSSPPETTTTGNKTTGDSSVPKAAVENVRKQATKVEKAPQPSDTDRWANVKVLGEGDHTMSSIHSSLSDDIDDLGDW